MEFCPELAVAARDVPGLTRDPIGIGGSQEGRHRGNVLRLADPAHGSLGLDLLAEITVRMGNSGRGRTFRFHHAGSDGVDADLFRPEFLGQRDGDDIDRGLCGAVDGRARDAERGDDGTKVDDAAAGRIKMLHRFLRREQRAQHIQVEVFVEMLFGNGFQRREIVNSRIVDQDVEATERLLGFREECLNFRLFRNIGFHRDGLATVLRDLRDDGFRAFLAGRIIDDHRGAFRGEMLGDGGANAFGCSGDDCNFSFDFFHNDFQFLVGGEGDEKELFDPASDRDEHGPSRKRAPEIPTVGQGFNGSLLLNMGLDMPGLKEVFVDRG